MLYHNILLMLTCTLILGGLECEVLLAQQESRSRKFTSEEYDQGLIFLNGKALSRPYLIEADRERITINGQQLPASIYVTIGPEDPEEEYYRTEFERHRGGEAFERRERKVQNPSLRLYRFMTTSLDNADYIILFDETPFRSLSVASDKYDLAQAILADSPKERELAFIPGIVFDEQTTQLWSSWLKNYHPPAAVANELQQLITTIEKHERETVTKIAAVKRLENFSYPLTLASMIFSVIAFGQLLQWIGKGFAEPEERKPESERFLVMALLLMLGMSLIDLIWTILAGQAGIMREVNPVAAAYMDSPRQLAFFKVVATSCGLSILYFWRHKPVMQQATWWMCLVCVLVTFRWVVFNSMTS